MIERSLLPVRKPVSMWNKPLKAEWRGLFTSLTSAATNLIGLKWNEFANDVAGAVTSLGLDTGPDERAWLLIRRALVRAVFDMVREYGPMLRQEANAGHVACDLDARLEATELEIGPDFMDRPGELAIVREGGELLAQWLQAWGARNARPGLVTARLRAYFVHALSAEWRSNRQMYQPILEALETPFLAAGEREQAWQENAARLRRRINEPMFGEPFGLEQIFVPRRAAFEIASDDRSPGLDRGRPRTRQVVSLHEHLRAWLAAMDRRDAIRLISGGPGSGKSSFARMLASEQAEAMSRVVFVPLFELDVEDSLADALDAYMKRQGLALTGLLRPDQAEERLLLILDGLDELTIRGRLGAETSLSFVRQVERVVADLNRERCRAQVLITGRDLAVQAAESELRKPGQIIHLVPYYLLASAREGFRDPGDLLVEDQRHTWWARYGWAAGLDIGSMPEALGRRDLEEITSEPLLCYLVALSFLRERIDFSAQVSLSEVYRDLLRSVYDRGYEGQRQHPGVGDLDEDEFIEILEEIGLAAWHGSGRTTTLSTIRAYCKRSTRLCRLIERFEKDAEAGVTSLLLAFYFRQGERTELGDRAFEFTHKSFGEYLTARRVVRGLERMARQLDAGDRGEENGWMDADALAYWAELCGPSPMDRALVGFVRGEIARHAGQAGTWQRAAARLFGRVLRAGMPMERLKLETYRQQAEHARHAEIALVACMNACARVSGERSRVDWPAAISFAVWLKAAQGHASEVLFAVLASCLSHLDLSGVDLLISDLSRADLQDSDLGGSNLDQSILAAANLTGARLRNTNLAGANLASAHLTGADMTNASLTTAQLASADLSNSNLQGAWLNGARLHDAVLRAANLGDAKLAGASLAGACLAGARLCGTNLAEADLHDADLQDAELRDIRYSPDTRWPVGFDPASIPGAHGPGNPGK
jgi:uncharacterized protein YjbI with pentapeptide repeats